MSALVPIPIANPIRAALAALLLAAPALAQPLTLADVEARARDLDGRAETAYHAGDFAGAMTLWQKLLDEADPALIPDIATSALYNLACAASLAGEPEVALAALDRVVSLGWTGVDQVRNDPDLASLRGRPELDAVIARMEAARALDARVWDGAALATPYRETLPVDEKVAGLSRLWMEAKVDFAYFDQVPDLDWDAEYLAALPQVREAATTFDYYRILARMIAKLQDGHSNVIWPKELQSRVWAGPPVATALVEDRVLVTGVFNESLGDITVGDEVLAVDGVPVKEYAAERVAPFVCASTPQDRINRTYGQGLLQGARDQPIVVTLETAAGERREVTLPRHGSASLPPPVEARMLEDGVAYLAIRTFSANVRVDSLVAAAWDGIAGARSLVIDIRENGGGNSGWWVMAYLAKEYEITDWATRQYRPVYRAWGRTQSWYRRKGGTQRGHDDPFRGKVALLTSPRTFSAAEDFAAVYRFSKRGPVVGEATGGSTGQPLLFRLPGGGSARVCSKRDTYPDGTDFVGVGVLPDVEVHPTVAGIRAGRDEVLERAVELVR